MDTAQMNEADYLSQYDQSKFDSPIISIDSVLFTYHEQAIKVLMVKRANHPDLGKWGLPGGFVDLKLDQTLEDCVLRKLKEKTGIAPPYIEQLKSYGSANRDKRGWSITVCYTALMAYQNCQHNIELVEDAQWIGLEELSSLELAFDHTDIIEDARHRLAQKALYSIVPAYALPEEFTLPELQHLHEVLIGKEIQKKSFRRRIEQAELLIETDHKRAESGRPAKLYRMKESAKSFTFIRNLEG